MSAHRIFDAQKAILDARTRAWRDRDAAAADACEAALDALARHPAIAARRKAYLDAIMRDDL